MHELSKTELHEIADNLSLLAGILQVPAHAQKANAVRKAERALVFLETIFSQNRCNYIANWINSQKGTRVIEQKIEVAKIIHQELEDSEQILLESKQQMQKWLSLSDEERIKLEQKSKMARHFIEAEVYKSESYILNRYQRYHALKELLPFSDKAEHLCEAIFHFENRAKYEINITKLDQKKIQAGERLNSVKRGFVFATIFCALIVTIPLCLPIAISLWNRRKEVEFQIANLEETKRREEKRVLAADEGSIASETIRSLLGNIPLEQIRRTLNEVRELRTEFQLSEKNLSLTTKIMSFLELNQTVLQNLFGNPPEDCIAQVKWFAENIEATEASEAKILAEEIKHKKISTKLRETTKGYSIALLEKSQADLKKIIETNFNIPLEGDLKKQLAQALLSIPNLLLETRQTLWNITHGQFVSEQQWRELQAKIQGNTSLISACLLPWNQDYLPPDQVALEDKIRDSNQSSSSVVC